MARWSGEVRLKSKRRAMERRGGRMRGGEVVRWQEGRGEEGECEQGLGHHRHKPQDGSKQQLYCKRNRCLNTTHNRLS